MSHFHELKPTRVSSVVASRATLDPVAGVVVGEVCFKESALGRLYYQAQQGFLELSDYFEGVSGTAEFEEVVRQDGTYSVSFDAVAPSITELELADPCQANQPTEPTENDMTD